MDFPWSSRVRGQTHRNIFLPPNSLVIRILGHHHDLSLTSTNNLTALHLADRFIAAHLIYVALTHIGRQYVLEKPRNHGIQQHPPRQVSLRRRR